MKLTKGPVESAQKVCLYGPEGIGKSTFASRFPNPLFIDTEGSTKQLDVVRTQRPSSWTMLLQQIDYVKKNPDICRTLVIDTADWAEQLCVNHICAKSNMDGLEGWNYGKGYTYLAEEFGRLLNHLEDIIDLGINVVFTAHAQIKKFEQPDEMGAYDRWELKLQRKTAPLVKEWADMILFANYKTYVVTDEKSKSKKAQGGHRIMYTTHHPAWDAKNRHNLKEELPLDFKEIAHCIPTRQATPEPVVKVTPEQVVQEVQEALPSIEPEPKESPVSSDDPMSKVPKTLRDLMEPDNVTLEEIQDVVAKRGYYPAGTPFENYDPDFVQSVLIAAWPQVLEVIEDMRLPF